MTVQQDNIAIRVSNLSKCYLIYSRPQDRLKQSVIRRLQRFIGTPPMQYGREFWALKDVSFEVKKGEAVGIIGRNGSGKSTLLQLVCGTLTPTGGTVETTGRIAALLELGSGFNLEFTGRENVYINGAVLGLTADQIGARFDRIAAFADIGDFIDQPVKSYSSGMYVRLAFAVQAFTDPDVLIIDEALAVGDVFFQQKCFKHLHALRECGSTLLFVSHDTAAIQTLCSRALLLDHGRLLYDGLPSECASRYYALGGRARTDADVGATKRKALGGLVGPDTRTTPSLVHNLVANARSRHGSRELEVEAVYVKGTDGGETLDVPLLSQAKIFVRLTAHRKIVEPRVGLHLYDRLGALVFAAGSPQLQSTLPTMEAGESILCSFILGCAVYPGTYTLSIVAGEPSAEGPNAGLFTDVVEGIGPLVVYSDPEAMLPFYGIAQLPLELHLLEHRALRELHESCS
jgi:ABC-type polysaccharide/polyol phosphate transport system ATPase subunit